MNKSIKSLAMENYCIQLLDMLIVVCLAPILCGCHNDVPKAAWAAGDKNHPKLLERLTAVDEAERFEVIDAAKSQIGHMEPKEVEVALTSLRPKNLSTLIYVCIESRNPVLYQLSPPARQALENSPGSYPNIAYYYARVNPDNGLKVLFGLYERHPDKRLPVCLAIGEVCQKEARSFLLAKAKAVKAKGRPVTHMLAGLKHSCRSFGEAELDWFLRQSLDREELIALSELNFELPVEKVKTCWQSGGVKRFFAIELVMGQPDKLFDALRWMIDQYLNAGDTNTVKQLMMSDNMRSAASPRVKELCRLTLKKLQPISLRDGSRHGHRRENKQ
jgi:hypothetical protein